MSERPFTLQDEIKFWADQVMDHMIFINTGLVEKEIKKQNLPIKLYTTSSKLAGEWKNVLSSNFNDVEEVKELATRTLAYQNEVKETQLDGYWIGWLSDSFYNHLNLELDYFMDKLYEEPFNIENELNFWLIERKTDTEATIKLLDPTEKDWEERARQTIELLEEVEKEEHSGEDDLVALTLNAFTELDKFYEQLGRNIKNATVKTNIHPLLAEHVKREGERAIKTLKWYLK